MGTSQELGREGENLAATFLTAKGYQVLGKNLRSRLGEVDLLMRDGRVIVLVEVKTSERSGVFTPFDRLGPAKQRKLWLLARQVAARYPDCDVRVDAVAVYWKGGSSSPIIKHLQNILCP